MGATRTRGLIALAAVLVVALVAAACGSDGAGPDAAPATTVAAAPTGCPPEHPLTAADVVDPAPPGDAPAPTSGPYPVPSPLDDPPLADGPALQRVLDEALPQLAGSPGAVALVWVPGVGAWRGAAGLGDVATGTPADPAAHFHIGSATKPFTVMTVLRLVDQGLLGLDDPVGRWFPEVPDGDAITVRQLAGMTAGIGSYTTSSQPFFDRMAAEPGTAAFTPEELVAWGLELPRVHAPGQGYFYSNTATVMLSLIAERVAGKPYAQVLQDEVLGPLGLHDTAFPAPGERATPRPALHGYFCDEGEVLDVTDWDASWGHAAGAMTSTLDDLATWTAQLGTGALVSPATFAAQTDFVEIAPGVDAGYGPGLADFGGWWGHNGGMPGYTTYAVYHPGLRTVLVLNVNSNFDVPAGTGPDGQPRVDTPATALFKAFDRAITATPR